MRRTSCDGSGIVHGHITEIELLVRSRSSGLIAKWVSGKPPVGFLLIQTFLCCCLLLSCTTYPSTLRTTVHLVFFVHNCSWCLNKVETWYLLLGSRMRAKDNVKSGGVIPFDHKGKEETNHNKAQAWYQRLRVRKEIGDMQDFLC